ncbi:MAG: ribonuclease III [Lachnospiraceae bacterium]|nr:ribonuclease III [Lachnospiraceae bacterium]
MLEFRPEEIEEKIAYHFKDRMLLRSALSHGSYVNELKINTYPDYERLEFLGDAVLELVVSEYLYDLSPAKPEGEMTKLRAALVCEPTLSECAGEISLSDFILVGRGEEGQGSRTRASIVSDVFEALIGAIYLDGGFEAASRHIERFVLKDMERKQLFYDAKSILQERCQKKGDTLEYIVAGESGPDHKKVYTVEVYINGLRASEGQGSSKKSAEQKAAYEYLRKEKVPSG